MDNKYKSFHILTTIIFNVFLLISTFLTDNPMILLGILLLCLIIFINSKNTHKFKSGIIYFVPFSIITTVINIIFVGEGSIVLFRALGKNFTLEALIYALALSLKLLIVIYIFMLIDIMVDSDKAVSYFSTIMPKSTLTLMIGLKLFPTMIQRLKNLKEVYSLRGVNFEGKTLKDKIKSYIPIMSILLENSLEGAFDIGEAAYIRGFLSGKRSVYDRQLLKKKDYFMFLSILLFLAVFIYVKFLKLDTFDIYSGVSFNKVINLGTVGVFFTIVQMALSARYLVNYR